MKILQRIAVKQVLTEKSRAKLLENFTTKKSNLQRECDQLYFQLKKIEKSTGLNKSLSKQYLKEIESRKEKIKLIDFQIEQVHILPDGSELMESEVEAIINVEVGSNWEELIRERSIIIKDGIVEEIH